MMRSVYSIALCMATAVALYSNTFDAGFAWDDRAAVKGNDDLKSTTPLWSLLEHDFWGQNISVASSHKSYRPISVLSYRCDYAIAGPDPTQYHKTNVILHAINTGLFHVLASSMGLSKLQTLIVGLLFAVHPIHSEAVAGIVGRADLLSCIFYLIAVVCFIQSLKSGTFVKHAMLYFLGIVFTAISALSKEVGFTALGAFVLCEILFPFGEPSLASEQAPKDKTNSEAEGEGFQKTKQSGPKSEPEPSSKIDQRTSRGCISSDSYSFSKTVLWVLCPLSRVGVCLRLGLAVMFGVVFMYFRIGVHQGAPLYQWTIMENQFALMPPGFARTATIAYSHVYYLWLLLWPKDLAFDHAYASVEPVFSWTDIRCTSSLILYVILSIFIVGLFYRRSGKLLWCTGVAICSFLPASNVLVFVGTEVAERLLYLPTVGVFMGVGHILPRSMALFDVQVDYGHEKQATKKSVRVRPRYSTISFSLIVTLCLVACVARTWRRNDDWRSELRLFESGVAVHPQNIKALNNLANLYMNKHSIWHNQKAQEYLEAAIELYPDHSPAYYNLGLTYKQRRGGYAKAVESFYRGIFGGFQTPCGNFAELGLINLDIHMSGIVESRKLPDWYIRAGGILHATWIFQVLPNFLNTSSLALDMSKVLLEEASRRGCDSSAVKYGRGMVALNFGYPETALIELEVALLMEQGKMDGSVSSVAMARIYDGLAQAGLQVGRLDESAKWLTAATAGDPSIGIFRSHYAQYFEKRGKLREAEAEHKEAVKAEPDDPFVWEMYSLFLHGQKRAEEALNAMSNAAEKAPSHKRIHANLKTLGEIVRTTAKKVH